MCQQRCLQFIFRSPVALTEREWRPRLRSPTNFGGLKELSAKWRFVEGPYESCFQARIFIAVLLFFISLTEAQTNPRARDLGVPFDGTTGSLNAITDVKGVEVGDTTLMSGDGSLNAGVGPIRTGVTAVL